MFSLCSIRVNSKKAQGALRRPPFVFRAFLKIQSRFEMIAHGLQQRRTTP
jgi:hypothetical protein